MAVTNLRVTHQTAQLLRRCKLDMADVIGTSVTVDQAVAFVCAEWLISRQAGETMEGCERRMRERVSGG